MPGPEVGKPLPRVADAYTTPEKWELWILADEHHGPDWRAVFGELDFDSVWTALADAVTTAPVVTTREVGKHGSSCRVDVSLTLNARTATVRSIWHYAAEQDAPRLVTAFPTT